MPKEISCKFLYVKHVARYFGLKSPVPFTTWQNVGVKRPKNGINFAFGGTGVFDTSFPFPNMTTQINFFQKLIANSIFMLNDIHSSIALVSVSGNDYSFYQATNGSMEASQIYIFITSSFNLCLISKLSMSCLKVRSFHYRDSNHSSSQ